MAKTHYETLGLEKEATPQEIKKAFRVIARTCHPDVAGTDAEAQKQFVAAREAYEILSDPVKRSRYDRRHERRTQPGGGSFFDAFYRRTGGGGGAGAGGAKAQGGGRMHTNPNRKGGVNVNVDTGFAAKPSGGAPRGARTGQRNPGNAVGLDDLFNDFGFGGGSKAAPKASRRSTRSSPGSTGSMNTGSVSAKAGQPRPRPSKARKGDNIPLVVQVPQSTAKQGGSVELSYRRMARDERWNLTSEGVGLVSLLEESALRVPPDSRPGDRLSLRGGGHYGPYGGAPGDLLVTIEVVDDVASAPKRATKSSVGPSKQASTGSEQLVLKIGLVESLLGGRVQLSTPQGAVFVTIPPGTSGGSKFRLRGKGVDGDDVFAVVQIQVPKSLDAESRELIEAFARLNPS